MRAPRGAYVASGHAHVSEAAVRMLRDGGNAFDAAVAAGFAATVAEPAFASIGGGGFLLARGADGSEVLLDFFVDTPGRGLPGPMLEPHFLPMTVHFPGSAQVFNIGLGSAAVPGALAGLLLAHRRLARLPLREVLAPAVALARGGVVLTEHQAYVLELLVPIHTLTAAGRALYTPGGHSPGPGERLFNRDLASFLETLPEGGDRELYEGALAGRIERDMREGQGLLTREDLAAYAVAEREPLRADYRGGVVLTNPPPALGGTLLAFALALLDAREIGRAGFGSAEHLCALAAVMQEAEAARARGDFRATGGTTHVSVCDAEGNAASLSLSNGEGSGYVVPGTGIMLNNMLGEDDLHPDGFHASPPGERVASMMSPCLWLRDGAVRMVLGSGGSKRIRSAILQVLSGVVDFGLGVREAVEAPRAHWDGEQLQLEPGFDAAAAQALAARWPVNPWPERNLYFGGVHAVDPAEGGGADPRRGGCALAVEEGP